MTRLAFLRCIGAVLLSGWFSLPAFADNGVYRKVAPSAVWFFERGFATGVLVDVANRLVLTAEHAVRDVVRAGKSDVKVIFAQTDAKKNVVTEKGFYGFEKKKVLFIPGRVVYSNRLQDLALIQLDKVPPGVAALPLAGEDPQPGDAIHVTGNSTFLRGGLFSYCTGAVRNSYHFDAFAQGNIFFSLAHHAPTNRGDSGGPVVNDRAELVGIVSQGTTGSGEGEQVIDQSVHVAEIRKALQPTTWPAIGSLVFTGTTNLPNAFDWFYLPVRSGGSVGLELRGNGRTDLDLYAIDFDAKDQKDRLLVKETGLADQESGRLTPGWSGMMQVGVQNLFRQSDPQKGAMLTPRNTYTLHVSCATPVRGPCCIARPLPANSTDTIKVHYEPGSASARLELRGDGDTELQLIVQGPDGREIGRGAGSLDRKSLSFPVSSAGYYTIQVQNNSDQQFNGYVLRID